MSKVRIGPNMVRKLVEAVTDGGNKTCFICPSDAGLECPRKCGELGCTVFDKKTDKKLIKKLRRCWVKAWNK